MNLSHLYITFIALSLFTACEKTNLNQENDRERFNLKGNVKSLCIYSFEEGYDQTNSTNTTLAAFLPKRHLLDSYLRDEKIANLNLITFNKRGQITEELTFHADIDQNTITKFEYDNIGNNISKSHSQFDGISHYSKKHRYDKKNNLVLTIEYGYDTISNFRRHYTYNDEGLIQHEYHYDKDRILFLERIYSYNTDQQVTEIKDGDGKLIIQFQYEEGEVVEYTEFYGQDEFSKKVCLEYDTIGNVTYELHYDPWLEYSYTKTYQYDSAQNLTATTVYDATNNFMHKSILEYDDNNNLIKKTKDLYNGDTILIKSTNTSFDQRGNKTRVREKSRPLDKSDWISTDKLTEYVYDRSGNIVSAKQATRNINEYRVIEYY